MFEIFTLSEAEANMFPSVFNVIAASYDKWAPIIYILEPLSKWTTLTVPTVLSGQANTHTSFDGLSEHKPFGLGQVSMTSIIFKF
jgi:hypothetical protein